MTAEEHSSLEMAILVPANAAESIHHAITQFDSTIQQNETAAHDDDLASGFDPVTVGGFVWIGIKIVAPAAVTIGLNVLSNHIWDEIKKQRDARRSETFELPVRFRSGERFVFKSTSKRDLAKLKSALERHEVLDLKV